MRKRKAALTEREYIMALGEAAADYLDLLIRPAYVEDVDAAEAAKAMKRWESMRDKLSPHTVIAMSQAWLERDDVKSDLDRIAKDAGKSSIR